jgi:hypothetical protein
MTGGIPVIYIDGEALPAPDLGMKILRQQLVDSGRNAKGEVIAQKINRRLIKVDSLKWTYLSAEDWGKILRHIEGFFSTLMIWDAASQDWINLQVYWGDATEEPYEVNEYGEFISYKNCQCNIIDMGKEKR